MQTDTTELGFDKFFQAATHHDPPFDYQRQTDPMSNLILFAEQRVRRAWNQAEQKWYFAVVDVIAVLTESPNPQVYWRVMKKRLADEGNQTVTKCNALKMTAADGKQRLGEASTTEIARKKDAQGFPPNQAAPKAGGSVAGNARRQLEAESGRKVSTAANFKSLPEAKTRKLSRGQKP
jgi:hypothetical protein